MDEGRKLQRIMGTAKDPVRLWQVMVVLMSGQGQSVRNITTLQVSDDCVRDVIRELSGAERGSVTWRGIAHGEAEYQACSVFAVLDGQGALVGVGDLACDRQPQPGSSGVAVA